MWDFIVTKLSFGVLLADNGSDQLKEIIPVVTVGVNAALGVLVVLEVVFATVKAVGIGGSVIRNSDEPDTRAVYISSLKWPIIAIIGTIIVIAVANVVIKIVGSSGIAIET